MKNCCCVFLILLTLAILCPGMVYSQISAFAETYDPAELLVALGATESSLDDNFVDLVVTVEQPQAGVVSPYNIDFSIEQYTYDLMKNGGLKIAFPAGFDLGPVQTITISDDFLPLELEVERFVVSNELLTIYLQQVHRDDDWTFEDPEYVSVSLSISNVGNPATVGAYQMAAVAFKQNNAVVAGPTFSSPFTIEPNNLAAITVYPDDELTVRAGDVFTFSAEGFDQFGNKIEGLTFTWSLDCNECIGFFTDSTLTATTPGQGYALATFGGITGQSGLITVLPGALARIDLALSDTQFMGNQLRGSGEIALFDAFDNPKIDYSLSSDPFYLYATTGDLNPDVLTSDDLIIDGVVQLLDAGVVYRGPATTTDFTVDAGQGISDNAAVSFNGYDLLEVLNADGSKLDTVFVDQNLSAMLIVKLGGNITPVGNATLKVRLLSQPGIMGREFPPGPLDQVDTLIEGLMHRPQQAGLDTLVIWLEAEYEFEGAAYTTTDSAVLPLTVLPSISSLSIVEGTFKPDSIVARHDLDISFDAASPGFEGPVDSATLMIRVFNSIGGTALSTLFEGAVMPSAPDNGVMSFSGISGYLKETLAAQWYPLEVQLRVYSPAGVVSLDDEHPDSVFVISSPAVGIDLHSFAPTTVSAGAVAQFRFIFGSASDYPLEYVAENSSFTLSNDIFNSVTELVLSGGSIVPGENEFVSDGIFIPGSLMDHELNVLASIEYRIPETPYTFRFESDFNQLSIPVTALPVIQILQVDAVAPNTPNVNTDQAFQISATVANVSPNPISSLGLTLSSDGGSSYDAEPLLVSLQAYDTSEFTWEVTAAPAPNPAEIFAVDIEQSDVIQLPALDHVALVTVEAPAELELTYSLFGVENGLIDYGNNFNLTVELVNHGTAAVTGSQYLLTVDGLDENGPDTLSGRISEGIHIEFSFVAPQHDTVIDLAFALLDSPVDMNIDAPAMIGDTSFELSMQVISAEASLLVEAATIGTNLVLPGREQDLFQLAMTNTGISSATCLQLDRIALVIRDTRGRPVEAMSIFNIGTTGFWENDIRVSTLTAGDSLLLFSFDQFLIEPQVRRNLVFRAEFEPTDLSSVVLDITSEGFAAHFVEGPNAGLAPIIVSDTDEGQPLITQALTIKESGLGGSFMIETNPFNPEDPTVTPVRLSYELDSDVSVEFRIFSITGEEVYARDYSAGGVGGSSGENVIEWDGCNNNGHVVLNGVYVALVKNTETGESARIKIAVVK